MFRDNIYSIKEGVRDSISNNGIVLIGNALLPEVADDLYRELHESTAWVHQDITIKKGSAVDFKYSRDRISLDSDKAPPSLLALREFLRGDECRNFISYISGLACLWIEGSAARLGPGSSIGVHNDDGNSVRTVGFNLYLNKNWQPDFGGEFVFLNPYVEVIPEFNRLCLFRATKSSHHKVNMVSNKAVDGRLAVRGWFSWEKH
jgi:hypothetical protein